MVLHIAETGLQVAVALSHHKDDLPWTIILLITTFLPIVLVNLASAGMTLLTMDFSNRRCGQAVCFLFHVLQMASGWRYFKLMIVYDDRDYQEFVTLRLVQVCLQNGPFILLQSTSTQMSEWSTPLIIITTMVSIVSMALAFVTYPSNNLLQTTQRVQHKGDSPIAKTWPHEVISRSVSLLWRTAVLMSRFISVLLFTHAFQYWIILILGGHWFILVMFTWGQNLAGLGKKAKHCRNHFMDVVLCYTQTYDVLFTGQHGCYVAGYYCVFLVENTVMVFVWYTGVGLHHPNRTTLMAAMYGTLLLGLLLMCINIIYLGHLTHPAHSRWQHCRVKNNRDETDSDEMIISETCSKKRKSVESCENSSGHHNPVFTVDTSSNEINDNSKSKHRHCESIMSDISQTQMVQVVSETSSGENKNENGESEMPIHNELFSIEKPTQIANNFINSQEQTLLESTEPCSLNSINTHTVDINVESSNSDDKCVENVRSNPADDNCIRKRAEFTKRIYPGPSHFNLHRCSDAVDSQTNSSTSRNTHTLEIFPESGSSIGGATDHMFLTPKTSIEINMEKIQRDIQMMANLKDLYTSNCTSQSVKHSISENRETAGGHGKADSGQKEVVLDNDSSHSTARSYTTGSCTSYSETFIESDSAGSYSYSGSECGSSCSQCESFEDGDSDETGLQDIESDCAMTWPPSNRITIVNINQLPEDVLSPEAFVNTWLNRTATYRPETVNGNAAANHRRSISQNTDNSYSQAVNRRGKKKTEKLPNIPEKENNHNNTKSVKKHKEKTKKPLRLRDRRKSKARDVLLRFCSVRGVNGAMLPAAAGNKRPRLFRPSVPVPEPPTGGVLGGRSGAATLGKVICVESMV